MAQALLPSYSSIDALHMTACTIDEAVRRLLSVGARLEHIGLHRMMRLHMEEFIRPAERLHPELTGLENIYLSGAILGMKHAEIRRQFDAIVEFAEIEAFLSVGTQEGILEPGEEDLIQRIIDFGDIKEAFDPIREQLDHYYLNEIEGLENPTAEMLARWIWQRLEPRLEGLSRIEIQETCTSGCTYGGD